jgi:hypothetical protein
MYEAGKNTESYTIYFPFGEAELVRALIRQGKAKRANGNCPKPEQRPMTPEDCLRLLSHCPRICFLRFPQVVPHKAWYSKKIIKNIPSGFYT